MTQILFPDVKYSWTEQDRQRLRNSSSSQEYMRYMKEITDRDNSDFLDALALGLDSANHIAAYVITGGAFGYSFRDAIVQVTPNLLHVHRWHEVTKDIIESGFIKGKIDWQKVIAVMKQDGHEPDDNFKSIGKNSKAIVGRYITTYAVSKNDCAWVTIVSGRYRLHNLMVELMNRKTPLN